MSCKAECRLEWCAECAEEYLALREVERGARHLRERYGRINANDYEPLFKALFDLDQIRAGGK